MGKKIDIGGISVPTKTYEKVKAKFDQAAKDITVEGQVISGAKTVMQLALKVFYSKHNVIPPHLNILRNLKLLDQKGHVEDECLSILSHCLQFTKNGIPVFGDLSYKSVSSYDVSWILPNNNNVE